MSTICISLPPNNQCTHGQPGSGVTPPRIRARRASTSPAYVPVVAADRQDARRENRSANRTRCRSPSCSCCTRRRAAVPRRAASRRSSSSRRRAAPNASRSRGSGSSTPSGRPRSGPGCRPRRWRGPAAPSTSPRSPSARSPRPGSSAPRSSACRCSALTMIAFSSTSSIGRQARCTRRGRASGSALPHRPALAQDLRALGVVGRRRRRPARPASGGAIRQAGATMAGEAGQHAGHVLEPVPAADLHDQPGVGRRRRPVDDQIPRAGGPHRGVPSRRVKRERAGRDRRRRSARLGAALAPTSAASSSRFFAENGSIDGGITHSRSRRHPARGVLPAREHERVGVFDVGPQELPALVGVRRWTRRARRDSARPRGRRCSRRPSARPAVCGSWSSTMSRGANQRQ